MPEFSRFVCIRDVDADGWRLTVRAGDGEREAVAKRLDLLAVKDLSATVHSSSGKSGTVRLNVDFSADVVQSCVVSLEPVSAHVSDTFSVLCGETVPEGQTEVFVDPEGDDPGGPLVDGQIDLGELITQYLSLALEPFPRAAGVEPAEAGSEWRTMGEEDGAADAEAGKTGGAFAALERLIEDTKGNG
jgi:uncharacterized metal-binding protein YceD (DUF177 family)